MRALLRDARHMLAGVFCNGVDKLQMRIVTLCWAVRYSAEMCFCDVRLVMSVPFAMLCAHHWGSMRTAWPRSESYLVLGSSSLCVLYVARWLFDVWGPYSCSGQFEHFLCTIKYSTNVAPDIASLFGTS